MKIMAPAGDLERLNAAIKAGADEVYMGVAGFGARRFAKNFTVDEYCDAIDLAHKAGVSVHLTFNTMLSDAELELVYPDILKLYEQGLDEVIVQDLGVARWLQANFPELALCASTQLSPGTVAELKWYEEQGFKRVVLARELSLEQMRKLREQTKIEIEVFASGALCLGCSGKCYLSSFIGGRSGNRGMCAQPCRQYYKAQQLGARGDDDVAGLDYGYFLSLKDQLQGSQEVAELMKIGIDSIKIEGRMKSPQYVYEIVRYYRDLVDKLDGVDPATTEKRLAVKGDRAQNANRPSNAAQSEEESRRLDIAGIFNRGYAHGYYYERDPKMINEYYSSNFGVEVGKVRRDCVRLTQPLRNGDGVVFLDETARKLGGLNVSGIKIVDPTNSRRRRLAEYAEPGDLVQFDDPIPENADTLYRTFNYLLNKEVENALKQTRRREPLDAALVAKVGKPLELTLKTSRASVTLRADQPVEPAQKKGVDHDALLDAVDRFGETCFYLRRFKPTFDANAFVPKSLLNQMRQVAVDALEKRVVASYRRKPAAQLDAQQLVKPKRIWASDLEQRVDAMPYIAVVARTLEQYEACKKLGIQKLYRSTRPVRFEGSADLRLEDGFAPIAGSLVDAIELEARAIPFTLDWYFNIGNSRSVQYLAQRFPHADTICLSPEISDRAVASVIANTDAAMKDRKFKFALPVYGRLLAMFTQKTLFDSSRVRLENADERRVIVEQNAARKDALPNETGSSLYLQEKLDLLDAIPWILQSGVEELRVELVHENYGDVLELFERIKNIGSGAYHTYSYGFTRDGVF